MRVEIAILLSSSQFLLKTWRNIDRGMAGKRCTKYYGLGIYIQILIPIGICFVTVG